MFYIVTSYKFVTINLRVGCCGMCVYCRQSVGGGTLLLPQCLREELHDRVARLVGRRTLSQLSEPRTHLKEVVVSLGKGFGLRLGRGLN